MMLNTAINAIEATKKNIASRLGKKVPRGWGIARVGAWSITPRLSFSTLTGGKRSAVVISMTGSASTISGRTSGGANNSSGVGSSGSGGINSPRDSSFFLRSLRLTRRKPGERSSSSLIKLPFAHLDEVDQRQILGAVRWERHFDTRRNDRPTLAFQFDIIDVGVDFVVNGLFPTCRTIQRI